MDEGPNSYSIVTNPTALANNAIKSISFQEPQQAIQDALRHLLTLIQEQQASTHELNSQCNGISPRIDVLEQKYLNARQVQRAKEEEQKKELQEEFQQQYGSQINNLVERLASSEKDNHDLREEMKNMDSRYGQELSVMRNTLNLFSHNLGFSPGDDGDRDGNNGDGSEKEQKDWETAAEIAEMEKNHRVQGGKIKITRSKQPSSTIQSELRDRDVGLLVEHEDIREEVDDGSVDHLDKEKKHPGETDERSLTVHVSAATSSGKGAIVGDDSILTKPLDEAADETNKDDASINVEDIANDIDKTLPTVLLRPDAGQGLTNNTAVSKQSPARSNQMNSASHRSSTAVFNASKTKLAFHETLVSRLERLEGTYDEILRKHHNGNSKVECEKSATSTGNESESSNNNVMKKKILELEMEILALKSRVDSTDAFLDGCIDASNKTEEKSSDNSAPVPVSVPAPAPASFTLSSILQEQRKITQKNIEETNQRVDALSMELSSRLAQNELELSQQSRGQSDFSPAKVEMDKTHSHSNLVDDAVVSDLEQKMRLISDRLDDQEAKLVAQKSRNLPAVSTDDGWKNQVDKSLLRLEKKKVDSTHLDSTVASLENKCNTKYDALADTIRQLREDGLATSSDSTGSVSEASDGDDGRLEEALASIEAAQTTMGSLQNELESLISKLDDKPSLDQVKALLGSVESTYKERFATHEALQLAIGDIHQGLKQKMTRSDVSNIVSKSIEKARLGLTEEKDSLMIGRAPYRCIGCNSLFPGVSNSIATKVNHNALPTPSIGFGRSLHAKRYFHVREDGDKRGGGGGGGGVIRTRRPRHSAGTMYARR